MTVNNRLHAARAKLKERMLTLSERREKLNLVCAKHVGSSFSIRCGRGDEEREERSFIRLNAVTLAFTLAMMAFIIVTLSCIVALPVALNYLPGFMGLVLNIIRWPVMLVLIALALAFIYRYGPSRDEPKWRWITWGSALAALAWLGFSALFSIYASNFGSFNKTYGSLGAVIGFMTWMWLSAAVILIGGKLNAEMEHQTAKDSTEGTPQPIGARRAKMADTVGRARS
jgi:membrane protein